MPRRRLAGLLVAGVASSLIGAPQNLGDPAHAAAQRTATQRPSPEKPRTESEQPAPRVDDRRGVSSAEAVGIGVGTGLAGILLGRALGGGKDDPIKLLEKRGPQLPASFLMSSLTVRGFVKGNWPAVVEYTAAPGALLLLSVVSDAGTEFIYRLPAGGGREQLLLRLPSQFGDEPNPANYRLLALLDNPRGGPMRLIPLRVHGLGAGDRAVGSVGIDRVTFAPATIHRKRKEQALYGFYCRNGFQNVAVEFMHIRRGQGFVNAVLREQDELGKPVGRDTVIKDRRWRPKKRETVGDHFLQVRGWMGKKEGDWVIAWSDDIVSVSE